MTISLFNHFLIQLIEEALKVLLMEKESFYGNRLLSITNTENNKIDDISKKYKIKGFYYSRDKHNVFKRSK